MKNKTLHAWASFLGSYIIILSIDYLMRSSDGDMKTSGISLVGLWIIWIPFILFSLHRLYASSKEINNFFYKILYFSVNIFIPILVILMLGLIYTVESGIDSL